MIGPWFAVLCWNNNPRKILGEEAFDALEGARRDVRRAAAADPAAWTGHDDPDVVIVGDRTGALKAWFDAHAESVLFLRPDRCIAGACIAQRTPELSAALFDVLTLTQGEATMATGPLLHVAQPAAESAGTVSGTP